MAHDPVLVENAGAWLRKAVQDLRRVGRCLDDEPPDSEDALFHCQQAAEKALKAFLTWHDRPFRKTHDLAALGNPCVQIDASLGPLIGSLGGLSEYAWSYRYPTELMEPPAPEVEESAALARQIVAEIAKRLPPAVLDRAGLLPRDSRLSSSIQVKHGSLEPISHLGGRYGNRSVQPSRCFGNPRPARA